MILASLQDPLRFVDCILSLPFETFAGKSRLLLNNILNSVPAWCTRKKIRAMVCVILVLPVLRSMPALSRRTSNGWLNRVSYPLHYKFKPSLCKWEGMGRYEGAASGPGRGRARPLLSLFFLDFAGFFGRDGGHKLPTRRCFHRVQERCPLTPAEDERALCTPCFF